MKKLHRVWAQAIILAVVEDVTGMNDDDRLYWHEIFKGATA